MKAPRKPEIEAGERLSRKYLRKALSGVTSVKAFIHRISLSTSDTTAEHIGSVVGHGKTHKNTTRISYRHVSYHVYGGTTITLYRNPNSSESRYYPKFRLNITDHDQNLLIHLSENIQNLKVRTAEYTIDLFCKDRESVSMMFYILRRYMYFAHRTHTSHVGGKFDGVDVDRDENCSFYVWKRAAGIKDVVIYERGDDRDKEGKGWPFEKVDRVRIEFLADSRDLHKRHIKMLRDFVANNKLSEFVDKKISFREFYRSYKLPMSYQDYNSTGEHGHIECFQEEYQQAKKILKNVSQYVREAAGLTPLRNKIMSSATAFETEWKKSYAKHVSIKQ